MHLKKLTTLFLLYILAYTGSTFASTDKIHYCALNGDIACVKLALEDGGRINEETYQYGLTALDIALIKRYVGLASFLMERRAKGHKKNSVTPATITFAAASGNLDVFLKLHKRQGKRNQRHMFYHGFMEVGAYTSKSKKYDKPFIATKAHLERFHQGMIKQMSYPEVTLLHIAAMFGNVDIMEYLTGQGAIIDVPMKTGGRFATAASSYVEVAVHASARSGKPGAVDLLISKGADINSFDSNGETPLFHAVRYSTPAMVEALLAKGGDPRLINKKGKSAYNIAVSLQKTETLKVFARKGYKVSVFDLIVEGKEDLLRNRIKANDVNASDSQGETLLHKAARKNMTLTAKLLIGKKAVIDSLNAKQETPLMLAARFGSVNTIKLLLEQGAKTNVKGVVGTPIIIEYLDFQFKKPPPEVGIVVALISKGANVNDTDKRGRNAVHAALNVGNDILRLIIEKGGSVNQADSIGNTPLHKSLHTHRFEIIKFLIASGADINAKNNRGDTLLTRLIIYPWRNGDPIEIIRFAVEHGADVNQVTKDGSTALSLALNQSNLPAIKLLVENGANVNFKHRRYGKLRKFVRKQYKRESDPKKIAIYQYFGSDEFRNAIK